MEEKIVEKLLILADIFVEPLKFWCQHKNDIKFIFWEKAFYKHLNWPLSTTTWWG